MKKVMHILPMNKLSGAEKMALLLCENMKEYEPIVVCGGDNLKAVFEKKNIKTYSLNFFNKNILSTMNKLKKIIKENDISIIHAHDNTASLLAFLTKKFFMLKLKVVSHIHNCYPWLKANGVNKKIDKFIRNKYDQNIACGKIVYDFYKENSDYLKDENIKVISNAIDVDEISNSLKSDKAEIKELKNKKVIGFVGRLSEQKGIIPFIKEIAKHKEKFNDSIFLIVGSGEQEGEVKQLLQELNLEKYFYLTGFQENINKYYGMMDIYFLPSLYEGLPMALLEAMAYKKPIVSMNVGSIGEIIKDKYNGTLVKQGDYTSFINELYNLKEDKALQAKYITKSFEVVSKSYNIKNYVKEITEVYNKLA